MLEVLLSAIDCASENSGSPEFWEFKSREGDENVIKKQALKGKGKDKLKPQENPLQRLPVADFGAVPIRDPARERRLVKAGLDLKLPKYLVGESGGTISGEDMETRIIEIYKLCYLKDRQTSVIREFAATFPYLIFKAGWLGEVVRGQLRTMNVSAGGKTLTAIASGLCGAANIEPRYWRSQTNQRVQLAREFRQEMMTRLEDWNKALDRRNATNDDDWAAELTRRAEEETASLIEQYPNLKICKVKLTKLLKQENLRKASILIASTVFWGASEHEVERGA